MVRATGVAVAVVLAVLVGSVGSTRASVAAFNGKIAFASSRDGNFEIYSMRADASDQARLTRTAQTDIDPDWSPDGTRIAFTSNREGNDDIYAMAADGTGETRLTTSASAEKNPVWAPGGRDIAFLSERDGNAEIYVMNADGSGQRRLTTNEVPDVNPSWSPDGRRIAFSSNRDGNYEVYVMNVDGTATTRLTTSPGADVSPSWSPDGRSIAFASDREGNYEIYAMGADGTGLSRLTRNLDVDLDPAWSPDGARIAFTTNRDGNYEIYSMSADGAAPTRLTTNGAEDTTPGWQSLAEPPPPADAVRQARFRGTWRESRYDGTLALTGRVSQAAVLTVALRQGSRVWQSATLPLRAGAFNRSIRVRPGLLPGAYALDIGVVGSPAEKPTQRKALRLAAPPEGVVSRAWVGAVIGGLPTVRFPSSTSLVAAHFRFASLPRSSTVTVSWYDPSGDLARSIRKPRAPSVVAFLATRDRSPMPPGSWQVVIRSAARVVDRVRYRIG